LNVGNKFSPQYIRLVVLPVTSPAPNVIDALRAFPLNVATPIYCNAPARPGVDGAPLKTSYGVIGESGEPAAKPGPSGGAIPGPPVCWLTNVFEPASVHVILPGEGAGVGVASCA
jgi:hypothetical protein